MKLKKKFDMFPSKTDFSIISEIFALFSVRRFKNTFTRLKKKNKIENNSTSEDALYQSE